MSGEDLPETLAVDASDPNSDAALNAAALEALKAKPLVSDAAPPSVGVLGGAEPQPEAPAAPPAAVAPPAPPAPDPVATNAALQARVAEMADAHARQLRAQQEAEQTARDAKAQLEAERAELATLRAKLKANPAEVLQSEGWSVEALNRHVVTGKTPESVELARLRKDFEDRNAALDKREREQREAAEAAAQRTTQQQIHDRLVNETIPKALEPHKAEHQTLHEFYDPAEVAQLVFQVMSAEAERARANPGEGIQIPTPSEAAARLNAQLVARVKRTQPPAKAGASSEVKPTPTPKSAPGLSNSQTPATHTAPPADDNDISDEALNRKAIAAMRAKPIVVTL